MEAKLNTEKTDWTEFPYLEGESDVISVQRGPKPGGAGGAYRAFGETLRGLRTTFGRVLEGPVTIQYPEEKTPVYPRFRGRHKLHRFEDTGLEKCVGCSLCAAACPADCIRVVAAENDPDHRVSAGERYAEVYEINLSRCIFCGYCEVACPFDAITMGHDYEMSDYNRSDLIFTKEMLLAEPIDRTPLRRRGRVTEVCFFLGAIGCLGGAIAVIALRNPFYSVLALIVHLISLAGLFLLLQGEFIAAAQIVVYAGAVMVLYVFVAAYVGNVDEPLWEPIPGQRFIAPLLGLALFVELAIAITGSGLQAIDTGGPTVELGFGSPSAIGKLLLERFLIAFEAASLLLLVAAVGAVVLAGRHRERGGQRPPGARLMDITWYLVLSALLFAVGVTGVLLRRSPLVILLCLELMLNAGNLALLAFSRSLGNQDGQVFALIVMVIAACEVVVGLGIIVAAYRRRIPLNVDDLRSLRG